MTEQTLDIIFDFNNDGVVDQTDVDYAEAADGLNSPVTAAMTRRFMYNNPYGYPFSTQYPLGDVNFGQDDGTMHGYGFGIAGRQATTLEDIYLAGMLTGGPNIPDDIVKWMWYTLLREENKYELGQGAHGEGNWGQWEMRDPQSYPEGWNSTDASGDAFTLMPVAERGERDYGPSINEKYWRSSNTGYWPGSCRSKPLMAHQYIVKGVDFFDGSGLTLDQITTYPFFRDVDDGDGGTMREARVYRSSGQRLDNGSNIGYLPAFIGADPEPWHTEEHIQIIDRWETNGEIYLKLHRGYGNTPRTIHLYDYRGGATWWPSLYYYPVIEPYKYQIGYQEYAYRWNRGAFGGTESGGDFSLQMPIGGPNDDDPNFYTPYGNQLVDGRNGWGTILDDEVDGGLNGLYQDI